MRTRLETARARLNRVDDRLRKHDARQVSRRTTVALVERLRAARRQPPLPREEFEQLCQRVWRAAGWTTRLERPQHSTAQMTSPESDVRSRRLNKP